MFEDAGEAKAEIRTRTSKIIGGYVTENRFLRAYRRRWPQRAWSKGWWGGVERSRDARLTFFVVKDSLNELDRKVIAGLEEYGYCWKQLLCEGDVWYVRDGRSSMTVEQYVRARRLAAERDPDQARPQVEDDPHLEECIAEYEREGTLREIASSIYIEDHFLNVYYTVSNIDLIGEDEHGVPVYIEVKFKNEFSVSDAAGKKQLVFGIDTFQYEKLFPVFQACGMKIMNVVLYNDVKSGRNTSTTVIFDFLREKGNQRLLWKYKFIDPDVQYATHQFRAGYTSWYGEGGRKVWCIPLTEYRDWWGYTLKDMYKMRYPEGCWGRCPVCGTGHRVIAKGRNGEFMGCTAFKYHQNNQQKP